MTLTGGARWAVWTLMFSGGLVACGSSRGSGPALAPASSFAAWADAQGAQATVQIPVTVRWSVLGVEGATVYAPGAGADAGLALRLDEGALGVPLTDRLRQRCGADAASCAVWLEGRFGSLVTGAPAGPTPSGADPQRVFTVIKVLEAVQGRPSHARLP